MFYVMKIGETKRFVWPPVGGEEFDLDINSTDLTLALAETSPRLNQNLTSVEA